MGFKHLFLAIGVFVLIKFGFNYFKYKAPEIDFKSMEMTTLDGRSTNLNQFKGKYVLVDVWATWCVDCFKAMPSLVKLHAKLDSTQWVMVGLNNDDSSSTTAMMEKRKMKFPCFHMVKPYTEFGMYSIPSYFILNKKGELIYKTTDHRDWNSEESMKLLLDIAEKNE